MTKGPVADYCKLDLLKAVANAKPAVARLIAKPDRKGEWKVKRAARLITERRVRTGCPDSSNGGMTNFLQRITKPQTDRRSMDTGERRPESGSAILVVALFVALVVASTQEATRAGIQALTPDNYEQVVACGRVASRVL